MDKKPENEKWSATKWFFLCIAGIIILVVLGWFLMVGEKMVERKVLVESHQYKEGMIDRHDTLEASLAEIDTRLKGNISEQTRQDLEAQRATINVQLQAARRRK